MIDVCLSGNIFYDTVCLVDHFPVQNASNPIKNTSTSVGGIANLKRIFDKNNLVTRCSATVGTDSYGQTIEAEYCPHDIQVKPGETSHSIIISDLSKNTRTSLVNWGVGCDHLPTNFDWCKWHHISYLDTLHNWNDDVMQEIKTRSKVVTVDFCQSDHSSTRTRIFECLKYVDGIIASDVELNSLFEMSVDEICVEAAMEHVKFCILHTPEYCMYKDAHQEFVVPVRKSEKNINALGAGDTFCAHVIIARLNGLNELEAIKYANEHTKTFLEENS